MRSTLRINHWLVGLAIVLLLAAAGAAWNTPGQAAAPVETCYTLNRGVTPTGAGNITTYPAPNCSNGTQYLYGTSVQISAMAYSGYVFSYWSGDASGSSSITTVVMYGTRTVTANFTAGQQCYTLSRGVSPTGSGTIGLYPSPNCPNGTQYLPGTVVQMTATPYSGYSFSYWSGSASGTVNPYNIIMDGPKAVTANFESAQPCYNLTLKVSPGGAGTVNVYPAPNCGNGTQYLSGTVVQMTAAPYSGYSFSHWSGAASGAVNPYNILMDGPKTVTANFDQPCYSLDRSVSPAGSGTVTVFPPPNCTNGTQYVAGSIVEMTANPAAGYTFSNWSGSASGTVNPYNIIMDGPKAVTANFLAPKPVITQISPEMILTGGPGFTLSVWGKNFASGAVVRWNGSDLPTQVVGEGQLEATVAAGLIAAPGVAWVTVTANGFTSDPAGIAIGGVNPSPVPLRADPPYLRPLGQPVNLHLYGRNFTSSAQVLWNGTALPSTFLKSTEILVAVPADQLTQVSLAQLSVVNPAPGGGTSPNLPFNIAWPIYLPIVAK